MACAISREIDGQIELVPTNANASPPVLLAANPLSKVPALITEDGVGLFDSPVICEYLDALEGALPLFPRSGGARWLALKHQAMGDGIMDAAVARRGETQRPQEAARDALMARYKAAVDRTVAVLEAEVPHQTVDIGTISVGCALGYLDFRYADEPWREGHPRLTAWYGAFAQDKALSATAPA